MNSKMVMLVVGPSLTIGDKKITYLVFTPDESF